MLLLRGARFFTLGFLPRGGVSKPILGNESYPILLP